MPKRQCKPISEMESEDREQLLQREWESFMPCADCEVRDICKHAKSFHRPDFNPEVFSVSVTCSVKSKVYARFTTPEPIKNEDDEGWE